MFYLLTKYGFFDTKKIPPMKIAELCIIEYKNICMIARKINGIVKLY